MSTSHCQQCSHVIKGNVRSCPMCGGGMEQPSPNEQRHCPRCRSELTIHHYQNCQLDQCGSCHGLWLEPKEFSLLSSEFNVYRDPNANPDYHKPAMAKAESYLPCACCAKLMTRQNFKGISGIIIDMCINCGVWLDQDELNQIRSFIASGGLDKAQDRQLHNHSQAIDALDDRVSDLEMMEKMLNKFSVKRMLFRGF